MSFVPFEKIHIVMPGASSATAASPSYQSVQIPFGAFENLAFTINGGSPVSYLPGDANTLVTVDPISGKTDGFNIQADPNGLPYGATHVNFVVYGTGAAVEFDLIFGSDV